MFSVVLMIFNYVIYFIYCTSTTRIVVRGNHLEINPDYVSSETHVETINIYSEKYKIWNFQIRRNLTNRLDICLKWEHIFHFILKNITFSKWVHFFSYSKVFHKEKYTSKNFQKLDHFKKTEFTKAFLKSTCTELCVLFTALKHLW